MIKKERKEINSVYPFVSGYSYTEDDSISFLLPNTLITLNGADLALVNEICKLCNGFRTGKEIVENIISKKKYKEKEIVSVISELLDVSVLVDVHSYYLLYHFISSNPMAYFKSLDSGQLASIFKENSRLFSPKFTSRTYLEKLMEARSSMRNFSKTAVSEDEFNRVIWAVYGKIKRASLENRVGFGTIPSGGALYPLKIRVICLKKLGSLKKGVYGFHNGKIKFLKKISVPEMNSSFFGKQPFLQHSSLCIAIAADFAKTTRKYSNRGYRYALLEAGHAAQNAYLWCAENNLGIVEISGFKDEEFSRLVKLKFPLEAVLTTLFIGGRV